ncbi:MAG: hypothetical protein UCN61_08215 [Ruminococcus sp.]|nr:hypothetical protein [Ruminococcus sp.]
MQNNKKTGFLAVALASLIVASTATASVLSGCGGNEDTDGTEAVVETSVVSRVVDGVYTDEFGNILSTTPDGKKQENAGGTVSPEALKKAKENDEKSNVDSKTDDKDSEKSENDEKQDNDKKSDSKSEKSENGGGSNNDAADSDDGRGITDINQQTAEQRKEFEEAKKNIEEQKPNRDNEKIESSKELILDGNKYQIGDTVTCVYTLSAPEKLQNFQGEISYDNSKINCVRAWLDGSAAYGGLLNYKLDGKIKFNGVNIGSGFKYNSEGNFIIAVFEVTDSGKVDTSLDWQVVTGVSGDKLVTDGKAVDGLTVNKSYTYGDTKYEEE